MFEPTLNLVSRYRRLDPTVDTYHCSRLSVDVAGRDSCRFSPGNSHKPGPFFSRQDFSAGDG